MKTGLLWYLATACALSGWAVATVGNPYALLAMLVGGGGLLALSIGRAKVHLSIGPMIVTSIGAALVLATLVLRAWNSLLEPHLSFALAGYGVQLVAGGLRMPKEQIKRTFARIIVPIVGHSFAFAGATLVVLSGSPVPPPAMIAAMIGFTVLFTDIVWMRRQRDPSQTAGQTWEAYFLILLAAALAIATGSTYPNLNFTTPQGLEIFLEVMLRFTVLAGLAMTAGPPALPPGLRLKTGGLGEFWINSLAFLVTLSSVVFLLLIGAPRFVWPAFYGLTALLLTAILFEYASTGVALTLLWRRRNEDPVLHGPLPLITVVVCSKQERDMLQDSMNTNLVALPSATFLVAFTAPDPAMAPIMQELQDKFPNRVRGVTCAGLSKATDLNQVWRRITTPYMLVLDADETTTDQALRIAVKHMEADPKVGIVQGRKLAPEPVHTRLSRFIATERRFSTLLDHTTYYQLFDAAHFAGSAALVRKDVPPSIGGWTPASLTEDIEFSVRLHVKGDYTIQYEDRMQVTETVPEDFASLVRQRGRWARGWGEVFGLHILSIIVAAPRIGWAKSIGLSRQLLTSVNAPWSVFLPLLGLLWILQGAFYQVPAWLTWTLAAIILPSRFISFTVASLLDPDKAPRGWIRFLTAMVYGYVWLGLIWLLQLHALYLQFSGTPRRWLQTRLRGPVDG